MVKYRYYGMTWKFPEYVTAHGHRYKFGGTTDREHYIKNKKEVYRWSGLATITRIFKKKNRSGKEYSLMIMYFRDTGKKPKPKPFDWNDPENIRRYNLK